MNDSVDVAVLGGGPAGLAAALTAVRGGASVALFERAPHVGGLAASLTVGGQRVDLGSHRLHPAMPAVVRAELEDLLGDDLQERPRHGRIRLDGRWLGFPLRPVDLIRNAPPSMVVGFARDLVTSPWRRPTDDSFAEAVRAGLGPTMARRFYLPYARKLWASDPTDLSDELYARRVSAGTASGLVRRVMRGARRSGRTFLYPRLGFGEICDRLADVAVAAGAEVRTSAPVTGLRPGRSGVHVSTVDGEVEAGHVLCTLPASVFCRLVDPLPPAEVVGAAQGLGHRGALLVYLVLDVGRWTSYDAHYLPDPAVSVARVSEPRNYRDGPDPADRTVLCAEVPADPGEERWTSADDELGDAVVDDLGRSGLAVPPRVGVEVHRRPHVYPVYRRGHAGAQAIVERWAGEQGWCTLVGRQALFAHDNTHHALAMGWAAGGCTGPGGVFDWSRWRGERERFRSHVVDD